MSKNKEIVSVVFHFDPRTLKPVQGAKEYTYFFIGKIQEGDIAVIIAPDEQMKAVLVTTREPSSTAIRRASKAIIGIVDMSTHKANERNERKVATKEAWERYDGELE